MISTFFPKSKFYKVLEGKNLPSPAYVIVKGHQRATTNPAFEKKTKISKLSEPKWNETWQVQTRSDLCCVEFFVWSKRSFWKDDFLGYASVGLTDPTDAWLSLFPHTNHGGGPDTQPLKGNIKVKIRWIDDDNMTTKNNKDTFSALSIKELKDILRKNGVDFSKCVEKAELEELAWRTCKQHDKENLTREHNYKRRHSGAKKEGEHTEKPREENRHDYKHKHRHHEKAHSASLSSPSSSHYFTNSQPHFSNETPTAPPPPPVSDCGQQPPPSSWDPFSQATASASSTFSPSYTSSPFSFTDTTAFNPFVPPDLADPPPIYTSSHSFSFPSPVQNETSPYSHGSSSSMPSHNNTFLFNMGYTTPTPNTSFPSHSPCSPTNSDNTTTTKNTTTTTHDINFGNSMGASSEETEHNNSSTSCTQHTINQEDVNGGTEHGRTTTTTTTSTTPNQTQSAQSIESELQSEFAALTVKKLKEYFVVNKVDYSTCVEKTEMVAKAVEYETRKQRERLLDEFGDQDVPSAFIDCITCDIMRNPVFTCDGHSYEESAIRRWLLSHDTSPKTGLKLQNKNLIPNHSLRSQIKEWLDQKLREKRIHDRQTSM